MSTRAIAPIVGASVAQVKRDARGSIEPPAPAAEPEPESYWSPEESFVGAHPITGEVIEPAPARTRLEAADPIAALPCLASVLEVVALTGALVGFHSRTRQ